MKILTYEIDGIEKKHYGISEPGKPKYHDPNELESIELSVPGKIKWHVLSVNSE